MKLLTVFAALFAVSSFAQDPPVAPSSPQVYELSFSAQPQGTPETTTWASEQAEGPVRHDHVQESLAMGGDEILGRLIARKICTSTDTACAFRVRYQVFDADPENEQSTMVIRYAIRGANGQTDEGYLLTFSRKPSVYRLWSREGDAWREYTQPDEFKKHMLFSSQFDGLMLYLKSRNILRFTR